MRESWAWGRDGAGAWQNPKPVCTLGALLVAVASTLAFGAYEYQNVWTPLQQAYLGPYVRSVLAGTLTRSGRYQLLMVVGRHGTHLALDEEIEPVRSVTGLSSFALTNVARAVGDRELRWQTGTYDHARLHAFLAHWIYRDDSPLVRLRSALWGGLFLVVLTLPFAIAKDVSRDRLRKEGRRLKGPELLDASAFTRRLESDGIAFEQHVNVFARLLGHRRVVRIPRAREANHLLIMGDSGTGKSTLIREILVQIDARGDTAIIYDPAREYTPQFYRPARGDVILNPLDARSPTWRPGDELEHDAEAHTLARSLFPDQPFEPPFFVDAPRRIFAHLVTLRPTAAELAMWLRRPALIDQRVLDTACAAMIDRDAPAQRGGVLASLNMVADALMLVPTERDTTVRWSATAWAADRRGWLFLTSTPPTRDALLPLTSLWLDTLVLRLMERPRPGMRPVWFILDELASLQRLPQLHTAITENRKSHNPVVLGFQGRSQLETRYGHDAEAILSQAASKIFLGTSEPHAAKWIADTIGDVEIERLRESRSSGSWGSQRHATNFGLERQVEPLVMDSEIMGLPPFHGYLKFGNLVVRLRGVDLEVPQQAPDFVPRSRPVPAPVVLPDTPARSALAPSLETAPVASPTAAPSPASSAAPAGVDRFWD
jgi:hypothetical protein